MASNMRTTKRQYQPSNQRRLDSYFTRDTSERPSSPMSPPQPADVAANLLSVGMRVRKSVPEGYKTHKTLGSPGFPFPSSAPSCVSTRPTTSCMQTRELTPFCGLHKTGGSTTQEVPSSSAPVNIMREAEDYDEDMPGLSVSQTTLSTQASFASWEHMASSDSRKRTYEDEQEAHMDHIFDEMDADDAFDRERTMQRPMARMKFSKAVEQMSQQVKVFGSDDFEDAAFLRPRMELD